MALPVIAAALPDVAPELVPGVDYVAPAGLQDRVRVFVDLEEAKRYYQSLIGTGTDLRPTLEEIRGPDWPEHQPDDWAVPIDGQEETLFGYAVWIAP